MVTLRDFFPFRAGKTRVAPTLKAPDTMETRLTRTHWFWVTVLVIFTQAQVAFFVPIAISAFGLSITLLRAISLFYLLRKLTNDDPYSVTSRKAERLKNEQAKKYGDKKHPFRWSLWLSAALGVIAIVVVRLAYGYLFFRDSSIGFLFILIGIKYAESSTRRDAMLLVCLSSFALVTAFFYTQTPVMLITALITFFVMGGVLRSLTRPRETLQFSTVKKTMKRFSLFVVQGLPIAALLFFLFPRLPAPLWGIPQGAMAKTGLSETMAPGEVSELMTSDTVAFRVEFVGAPPPARFLYWRGPVFSQFDGLVWRTSLSPMIRPEPLFDSAREKGAAIRYTVMLEPSYRHWLFALEKVASPPRLLNGNIEGGERFAYFRASGQILTYAPISTMLRYEGESVLSDRAPAIQGEERFNVLLPRDVAPKTLELAQTLRANVETPEAYINSVLRYFREEPFYYTLTPDYDYINPNYPLDEFMFNARRGFCEHYAGAFVYMMRVAGVPARVVTGYQGGEINQEGGGYLIVRQSDAHAWAEVLIDHEWRRVDPTSAIAPERVEFTRRANLAETDDAATVDSEHQTWLSRLALRWDALKYVWTRQVIEFNRERQRALWQDWHISEELWKLAAIVLGGVFLWLSILLLILFRRAKSRDPLTHAWEMIVSRLTRAGLPRKSYEGAATYFARAGARWKENATLFARLDSVYRLLRYGKIDEGKRARLFRQLKALIRQLPSAQYLKKAPK